MRESKWVSQRARKPVVTLFQIRVVLLVPLTLLTILAKIFTVIAPIDPATKASMPLFIYADLDLFLVFLMTFLPFYRKHGHDEIFITASRKAVRILPTAAAESPLRPTRSTRLPFFLRAR